MAKHKAHKRGGPIRAHHHLAKGLGGKDPHASPAHNAANKAHGMSDGMSPADESCEMCDEGGGEMGGNADYGE